MKKTSLIFILAVIFMITTASESEFYADTGVLTIPFVKVGNGHVYDAKLKLNKSGSFNLLSYSEQPVIDGKIDAICTPMHVTQAVFNKITASMNFDQVNSLVGCEGIRRNEDSVSLYFWQGGGVLIKPAISVMFSGSGNISRHFIPK